MFSLAIEQNNLDAIWNEVKMIRDTVLENPEFVSLLCHPEMTQEKKISVLEKVFKGNICDDSMGFLHVLIRKGRIGEIVAILDYFDKKAKEYNKIGVVSVSTPMPLSNNQKEKVENRLLEVSDYESLEVHYELDESLLGGIVIRIGDRVLDNSIRTKMDMLSRQLYKVKL